MAVVSWERKVANISVAVVWLVTLVCFLLGPAAGYIWSVVLQCGLVCAGGYHFMLLVDYQEKVGLDAPGVERVVNPLIFGQNGARAALLAAAVGLMSPTLAIVGIAELGYCFGVAKVKAVDSTKLWKEINGALLDARLMLIAHCLHFALGVILMVWAFIQMF